jgi:RNA-directed DNA polymerase
LFSKILESENLREAWKRVRANKGAPGIDGMEVGDFPEFYRKHWETIRAKLEAGSYQPSPVKRVYIPKSDGSRCALGIPCVLDRLIQQAIAQILTPIYEPTFSDHSYGFRPGRSAHGAVEELRKEGQWYRKKGTAIDCDLRAFFDTVDQKKMMDRLRQRIGDLKALNLIHRFLKAGVFLPDGTFEDTPQGVPQGGPLSPLMANILLDELDHELEARGHSFVRYADDFIILCGSPRAGRRIMASVKAFLETKLKLVVNEAKSQVVKLGEANYLGFQILRGKIRWSRKSRDKFKATVRKITGRTRGVSPSKVIEELKLYIRGAFNYYAPGITYKESRELDSWLRRKVRAYYWKQWGRPRTRRRKLISLGIGRNEVKLASRSRKGPWRMSHNSIVQRAMTDRWLADQGVPSIKEQWIAIRYPNQKT